MDYDPARMLRIESEMRRFRNRFRWALLGYVILAVGVVIALAFIDDSTDKNRDQAEALAGATGAFCLSALQDDEGEDRVLHALAHGETKPLPPVCERILRRINEAAIR